MKDFAKTFAVDASAATKRDSKSVAEYEAAAQAAWATGKAHQKGIALKRRHGPAKEMEESAESEDGNESKTNKARKRKARRTSKGSQQPPRSRPKTIAARQRIGKRRKQKANKQHPQRIA